jgi:hypothetical protein
MSDVLPIPGSGGGPHIVANLGVSLPADPVTLVNYEVPDDGRGHLLTVLAMGVGSADVAGGDVTSTITIADDGGTVGPTTLLSGTPGWVGGAPQGSVFVPGGSTVVIEQVGGVTAGTQEVSVQVLST